MYKKDDIVITPYGVGIIVNIEEIYKKKRYGVFYENWPESLPVGLYKDDICYYWGKELKGII